MSKYSSLVDDLKDQVASLTQELRIDEITKVKAGKHTKNVYSMMELKMTGKSGAAKKVMSNALASSHNNFFLKEHLIKHKKNQLSEDKAIDSKRQLKKINQKQILSISFEESENNFELNKVISRSLSRKGQ